MRRLVPVSLVGRTVLVLILGLVLSQLASVVFFSLNRQEMATLLGRRQVVERIADEVRLMEATPSLDRPHVLAALNAAMPHVRCDYLPWARAGDDEGEGARVRDELQGRFPDKEIRVAMDVPSPFLHGPGGPGMPFPGQMGQSDRPPDVHPPSFPAMDGPPGPEPEPPVDSWRRHGPVPLMRVSVHLKDGTWLNFILSERAGESFRSIANLIPLMVGFLVVTVLSVLAVRRATKPLAVLAAAAERLGRDVGAPPVSVDGPSEVLAAARAFNEMQRRLRRFIDDRTQMIAAISHDLRTPITRLKLRAEFVEDAEQQEKMLADLDEMETMIAQTLAFGRDDAARETRRDTDIAVLLAELCRQFDASYEGPESLVLSLGPVAVKRAFANLLDNARKYGGGVISVRLSKKRRQVTAVIDDNGTGVSEADLSRIFQPFVRVEPSRNRDTGGTGLGLAVARSNIRAHGGDIVMENRPEGGLRVTVTLPC